MADPRSIHEFTTGQVEATTLLLGDFVDISAQSGYTTYKMSVSDLGEVILEDIEYTQELETVDKTIIGAINENKSVIGYSYDEYDPTTAYAKDDLCIYNNVLYKALQATTGNLPTNTTYWKQTSIAAELNELNTEKQNSLSNSDISITTLSQSVSDVTLKCTRYGNVACITGYFRTTASISANSSIFSGFPNPVVPSSDVNLYFTFLNETDNNLMRFRINRNYCELKNPVALASGKTFVGSVSYICD